MEKMGLEAYLADDRFGSSAASKAVGDAYERDVHEWFRQLDKHLHVGGTNCLPSWQTEQEQQQSSVCHEGRQFMGIAQPTPDILFDPPGVMIDGVPVRWIDAKATYLSAASFLQGLGGDSGLGGEQGPRPKKSMAVSLRNQVVKYTRAFGRGALLCKYGYSANFLSVLEHVVDADVRFSLPLLLSGAKIGVGGGDTDNCDSMEESETQKHVTVSLSTSSLI